MVGTSSSLSAHSLYNDSLFIGVMKIFTTHLLCHALCQIEGEEEEIFLLKIIKMHPSVFTPKGEGMMTSHSPRGLHCE